MLDANSLAFRNLIILSVLTLPLKGYCIWKASRNNQKGWFVALFVINTIGILELIYLFYFSKPKSKSIED